MRKKFILRSVSVVLAALVLGLVMDVALAQGYPRKPIRLIVPVAAGGGTDTTARLVAEKLSQNLGQSILVENRPGASNRIGTEIAAKAVPDGYTLIMVSNTHSISPSMYKKMPYDAVKDFEAITLAAQSPSCLSVTLSLPAKSVTELVNLAKSKPGKLNYGISGIGDSPHLNGELFKGMAGIEMTAIPFKGTSEAVSALLGGHVDLVFGSIAALMPHIQAGTVRPLAVTTAKRSPLAPDIPSMAELGYPGMAVTWYGMLAPAGTPKAIIAKLNTETVKILNMPDVRDHMIKSGIEPSPTTPEEFADLIKSEIIKWGKVIKNVG